MISERRYLQTSRIFAILQVLRPFHFGLTVSEIMDRLAEQIDEPVDMRTVYRDLRYLIEIGLVAACPREPKSQGRFRCVKRSELAELLR